MVNGPTIELADRDTHLQFTPSRCLVESSGDSLSRSYLE